MSELPPLERVRVPGGREVALGFCEVGPLDAPELSPAERAELERPMTAKRRSEWLAGRRAARRALLRLAPGLTASIQARAAGQDAGRPVLEPPCGIALSISHSGPLAVAAAARGAPLGVDLEQVAPRGAAFAEEAFAEGELDGYRALPGGLDPVTAAWALKEAVLKAWGLGLRAPLQRVKVRPAALLAEPGALYFSLEILAEGLAPELGPPPVGLTGALALLGPGLLLALAA